MERIWNKKSWWLSWFVCSKWNIIACRCIWKLLKQVCWIYELDPAHFLSEPGLAWQACLKKTEVELELLTDIDMLLMVEKGVPGGMCQVIHGYAKANNKYIKSYHKNIIPSHLMYLDASICMDGQCLKNFL